MWNIFQLRYVKKVVRYKLYRTYTEPDSFEVLSSNMTRINSFITNLPKTIRKFWLILPNQSEPSEPIRTIWNDIHIFIRISMQISLVHLLKHMVSLCKELIYTIHTLLQHIFWDFSPFSSASIFWNVSLWMENG